MQQSRWVPKWFDAILDKLEVPEKCRYCVFALCVGFNRFPYVAVWGLGIEPPSRFMNGALFLRFDLPFHFCFQVRWSATAVRSYLQTGIGFRPIDGRLSAIFRIQGDGSAYKQGGLSSGWAYGPL